MPPANGRNVKPKWQRDQEEAVAESVRQSGGDPTGLTYDQLLAIQSGEERIREYTTGGKNLNLKAIVQNMDDRGVASSSTRATLMALLADQTPDAMDAAIKESALARVRRQRSGSRRQSFVVGPRGLEGPMANVILGGGTSQLGT